MRNLTSNEKRYGYLIAGATENPLWQAEI